MPVVLFASIIGGIAVICHFINLKQHTSTVAMLLYLLTVALVAILIFTSGGLTSPFLIMWPLVAVFAGFFSGASAFIVTLIAAGQIALGHIQHPLELPAIIPHALFGIAPIIIGYVIWHRQPDRGEHSQLRDLTSHLMSVEGKADIVINSIDDGVLAIDKKGMIELINPAAQRLIGWKKGDALGLDWRSVLKLVTKDGKDVTDVDHPIVKAMYSHQSVHNDTLSLMTSGDKKRLVSVIVSPVGQGDGGVIVVFRDITKEKLEERQQAEFISTASHEMRTPVASIEGYLGLALNPNTAQIDERARDFISKAHESATHLGELFQDLLDISKAEDGRLHSEPQVLDISATVGDIFENLTPLAEKKKLRYVFKPNPSLDTATISRNIQPVFYAHVDPHQLREVVSNLIENAIKYTPQGEVIVDVVGNDKTITISIQDSGVGIPAEDLPHLFQKFYRVDNSDTREIGGTGLGLYLCRRLAEAMDGTIRAESIYKKGSTFFLEIPRITHEEAMKKLSELPEETPEIVMGQTQPPLPSTPTEPTIATATPAPTAPQQTPILQPQPPQPQPVQPAAPVAPAPQPAAPATVAPPVSPVSIPAPLPVAPVQPQPVTIPTAAELQPVKPTTAPPAPAPAPQPQPAPVAATTTSIPVTAAQSIPAPTTPQPASLPVMPQPRQAPHPASAVPVVPRRSVPVHPPMSSPVANRSR